MVLVDHEGVGVTKAAGVGRLGMRFPQVRVIRGKIVVDVLDDLLIREGPHDHGIGRMATAG